MFEFILGSIFGAVILVPAILVALIFKFPLKVRHGHKKSSTPTTKPPKSHTSPYLYHFFTDTSERSSQQQQQQQQQQPPPPPPPQEQQDGLKSSNLLISTRNDLLNKIKATNGLSASGESLNWLNLLLLSIFTTVKEVLYETDQAIMKTCREKKLPPSGTYDTTNLTRTTATATSLSIDSGDITTSPSNNHLGSTIATPNDSLLNQVVAANDDDDDNDDITLHHNNSSSLPQHPLPQAIQFTSQTPCHFAASGSTTLLPILNKLLLSTLQDIPFLGPTRITYLDFGSVIPQINNVKIVTLDLLTNTLIFDIGVSFSTDSTIELDLSADIQYENLLIATVPAQVAIANVHTGLNIRIAIDPGDILLQHTTTNNNNNPAISLNSDESPSPTLPSISISLLEPPILRFDLATSLGYSYWLTNLPFLHSIIHKSAMLGSNAILAPNYHTIELPGDVYQTVIKMLTQLATE